VGCEGRDEAPPEAPSPADAEVRIDPAEVARLRSLPYADTVQTPPAGGRVGVLIHDPARAQPGLNYFTNTHGCTSQLMAMDGTVIRSWRHEPCFRWANSLLLPNGDILVVHWYREMRKFAGFPLRVRALLRMNWEGKLLWEKPLVIHHDVELRPDGKIAALTLRHRLIPEVHESVRVRDNFITVVTNEGEFLEEASITSLLQSAPDLFELQKIEPKESNHQWQIDLVHANSLEWMRHRELAKKHAIYAPANVLVAVRHQNAVAIFDWERKKLIWAWGQDHLSSPHDATVLPSGNILMFDNGLGRKAPEPGTFYTAAQGSGQRLPNGNTLVTSSDQGKAFEVTSGGEVVWRFRNPNLSEDRKSIVMSRMRRHLEESTTYGGVVRGRYAIID
jgi:hypothetical protein